MLLSPGWSERAERAFIEEYMPPTGVFFDIGANAGYYTFFVAGRRSKSRIISIEPVHDYVGDAGVQQEVKWLGPSCY